MFDPALPIVTRKEVAPGTQAFLYDLRKAPKVPAIIAASSRAYDLQRSRHGFSYTCKSPIDTDNVTRILLRRSPKTVMIDGAPATDCSWDPASRTLLLRHPNNPDGVKVDIRW